MTRRSWLGNRLIWHPTQTLAGSRGRATTVIYRRERIPWLVSEKLITAFIDYDDFSLRFYDTSRLDDLDSSKCFWRIESNTLTISALAQFLIWPGAEAVFAEYSGRDLADVYPSSLFAGQLTRRWSTLKVPDWHVVGRGVSRMSFVSEIIGLTDGSRHAIELTDQEFAIYRHNLLRSSSLAESDQMLRLNIEQLDLDRMLSVMQPDDVVTVRYVARLIRRLLYQFAVEYESV